MENKTKEFGQFVRETIDFYIKCYAFLIKASKKYWYIILLAVLAVGAVWAKGYVQKESTFKGNLVYTYNYMDKVMYGNLISQLHTDIENNNFKELAKTLGIPLELAQGLVSLKAYNANNEEIKPSLEDVPGPIYVEVILKENLVASDLEKALTEYINTFPYVLTTITEFRAETESKIAFLDRELKLLDSLRRKGSNSGDKEEESSLDLMDYMELSEKKFTEKAALENTLSKVKAVEVFTPLKISSVQVHSSKKSKLLLSILILGIGFFISSFIYWYKNPNAFEE